MLVFSTQLYEPSLWFTSPTPPPFPKSAATVYTGSVWLGGGEGVLSCVGDHILQEFNRPDSEPTTLLYQTEQKPMGGGGGLRQKKTAPKDP